VRQAHILPRLAAAGFEGVYKCKTRESMGATGKVDGCALLWRRSKFRLVEQYAVEFNEASEQRATTAAASSPSSLSSARATPTALARTPSDEAVRGDLEHRVRRRTSTADGEEIARPGLRFGNWSHVCDGDAENATCRLFGHVALDARLARGVAAQRLAGGGELAIVADDAAADDADVAFVPAGSLASLQLVDDDNAYASDGLAERAHWAVEVSTPPPPRPPHHTLHRPAAAPAPHPPWFVRHPATTRICTRPHRVVPPTTPSTVLPPPRRHQDLLLFLRGGGSAHTPRAHCGGRDPLPPPAIFCVSSRRSLPPPPPPPP
jgi:hypothetical protein